MKIKKIANVLGLSLISTATLFAFSPIQGSKQHVIENDKNINIFIEGTLEKEPYQEITSINRSIETTWKYQDYTNEQLNEQIEEYLEETLGAEAMRNYDWRTVATGRSATASTGWKRAGNQPVAGHSFSSVDSGFNFNFSGGPTALINFGVSWVGASINVNVGQRTTNVSSHFQAITSSQVNRRVHLETNRTFRATEYRIEKRHRQDPTGRWVLDRMTTSHAPHSSSSRTVLAP